MCHPRTISQPRHDNNNNSCLLDRNYWEEKSKLNPVSNLFSFRLPGGKNLGDSVVLRKFCWTGTCLTGAAVGAGLGAARKPAW